MNGWWSIFYDAEGLRESERAVYCRVRRRRVWLPKSKVHHSSEVRRASQRGELVIPQWLSDDRDLSEDDAVSDGDFMFKCDLLLGNVVADARTDFLEERLGLKIRSFLADTAVRTALHYAVEDTMSELRLSKIEQLCSPRAERRLRRQVNVPDVGELVDLLGMWLRSSEEARRLAPRRKAEPRRYVPPVFIRKEPWGEPVGEQGRPDDNEPQRP